MADLRYRQFAGLALAAVILAPVAAPAIAEESTPLSTQQFMAEHVEPTAEIFWNAVGSEASNINGKLSFRDWQPETNEEWGNLRTAAVSLREYGEALASPAYSRGRGEDWMNFAQGMQEVSIQAEQAAVEQDSEAVFEVGGALYNVCAACHLAYKADLEAPGADEEVVGDDT